MATNLVDLCDRYLEGLGTTLWGRAFNVYEQRGRREAAEWLAKHIEALQGSIEASLVIEHDVAEHWKRRYLEVCRQKADLMAQVNLANKSLVRLLSAPSPAQHVVNGALGEQEQCVEDGEPHSDANDPHDEGNKHDTEDAIVGVRNPYSL